MAELDGIVKAFVVDADEVVGKIVELVRPTAKALAREKKKSFIAGVVIMAVFDYGSVKAYRAFRRGWDAAPKKDQQNNDGFTTH